MLSEKKKTGSEMLAERESKISEVLSVIAIDSENRVTIFDYGRHFEKEIIDELKKHGIEIEIIFDSPCG